MIKRRYLAVLTTWVFLLPLMASAMSFAKTLYLFSEVTGVVTQGGQPVAGAKVERQYIWHWKDQSGQDEVITEASGEFRFPQISESSFSARLMPHEPVIQQTIRVHWDGKEYLAYKYTKHSYGQNEEFPGKKLNLRCELGNSEAFQPVDEVAKLDYFGICRLVND